MPKDDTRMQDGEHLISYAYPSSPNAQAFARSATGCYIVRKARTAQAASTYAQALGVAAEWGTHPARWSMDHPDNVRFLPVAR